MIHYHGTPISGSNHDAMRFLSGRHAFVSYAAPKQIEIVAEVCQSFALDNGAFSAWKSGKPFDFKGYEEWARHWMSHPACDWVVIPDVIDGTERQNDDLLWSWPLPKAHSVPVWHLHESLGRFLKLCLGWGRVAIGSSGQWPNPGTKSWWSRMHEAIRYVSRASGYPHAKLHGLRMLDPKIFRCLPLSSADSTNCGRNCGIDSKWQQAYAPKENWQRATAIAWAVESYQSSPKLLTPEPVAERDLFSECEEV